ncbi:MFS transporter [Streptomyces sp. NPDC052225]|uniref:MFS transporter n=1 Tax=Streptomyces sp. NPDC052225 TaxID=3154949 RepID=UPI0034310AF2
MRGARDNRLGRDFGWLWGAYAASAAGSALALGAFQLIAVIALDSSPAQVSFLAAAGLAVGAVAAVPLGPWVEFRHKRPVMIGADLARCAALLSLPAAYALDALTFTQLVLVSVVVAGADIVFKAASGAHLKGLVPADRLMTANSRFESTMWTATALGPPLGGAAIGVFGPLTTVVADAVSYLLSAVGVRAIRTPEPQPPRRARTGVGLAGIAEGWRRIWGDPRLRGLFLNTVLFNSLVMAGAPLLTVLLVGDLGFAPWQYGLAFGGIPCLGGLVGARLSRPLAARFGERRLIVASGAARAVWPVGLAFIGPGTAGLTLAVLVEFGLVTCCGLFNPVFATYRLRRTEPERVARMLSAWSVTNSAVTALMTALWGAVGVLIGTREAIGAAGLLLLATPLLLLPLRRPAPLPVPQLPAT